MEIQTVAIIGLGALGILFGQQLSKALPRERLRVIADAERIARYQSEKIYSNGVPCDFAYVTPDEKTTPADLVLVAVKSLQLQDALHAIRHQVGKHTVILSLLNGITSEGIIAQAYGMEKVIPCVAYGMDAVRQGNQLTYHHMGKLAIGPLQEGALPDNVRRVADFFAAADFPLEVDRHMAKRIWGKFMLNVGVNQTVAVFGPNYGAVQAQGEQRETMIAAMREVMAISIPEGAPLTEEDLAFWLHLLSTLNPEGKPSMRQDVEARRRSEVELFAGTVNAIGARHGIATPVNRMLAERVALLEAGYALQA